ncbi:MAG: polyhydroxyalkanoate synthesis repressor PhaR [Gammaproteobacteria bacterium]|nr:polyhydroxyalkanoate synthesis repressor PhaR [Gammaproteobacteria bacterium]MDH3373396.1 polyhydroxyalkanoate synthesis repressor PhaR [Gammaproteobacteria bacterium]MDH3408197.1 polyhydroxyalkanoate synthesis repressor PhaR [Gammaproteobacteria bacterium]MDH3552228.1 polyhydroxyalkanoate synthesis repressor PhaR [Gammaproteobacteria bacterium]
MSTARVIKKYPNRRLYDTEESRYITLADIKRLVLDKTEFIVVDKKDGRNITRLILLQVISDQEQNGAAVLSEEFLARVICCYGNVLPDSIAKHLEKSLGEFMAQTQNPLDNGVVSPFPDVTKNTLTSGP